MLPSGERRIDMLGRVIAGWTLIAIAVGALPSTSLAAVERPFPFINVVGEGTVGVRPDLALLNGGVVTEGKTPREATDANARVMTVVIAAAQQAGVSEKDIRTANFNISPVQTQRRDAAPSISGYRVSNRLEVKVRDASRAGEVLDQLVAAGVNNVSMELTVAEPGKLLDEARRAAFEDAKRKAELYAKAAGAQVGRAIAISEDAEAPGRPIMRATMAAAAPATPVSPGEDTLRVQISVSFELNH
jgi:uncharacterized protein YggE